MANIFRLKRGTTEPLAGDLVTGELAINTGDSSVYTKLDDGTVSLVSGKSSQIALSVRNETGSTIPAMSAVYVSGASNNKPLISLALATDDSTSASTIGLTTTSISSGNNGEVVCLGLLGKVNTSAYTAGDTLWLSPSIAGGVTTTKPTAPNHAVLIGTVVSVHANQGKIEIRPQNGYEIDELHNVLISGATNKDLLSYDGVSGVWKNNTILSLALATTSSVNNFTQRQSITVADDTNPALTINQTGAGYAIRIEDSASPDTSSFIVDGSGNVMVGGPMVMGSYKMIVNGLMRASSMFIEHAGSVRSEGSMYLDSGTGSPIYIRPGISTSMTMLADGSIGIGTTTPTNKLDVAGTITCNTQTASDNSTKVATTAFVKSQSYVTSSALSTYALLNGTTAISVTNTTIKSFDASDNFVALDQGVLNFGNTSTPAGLSINQSGITFADSTTQTTAGIADAPSDSQTYGRNNGAWTVVSGGGGGGGTLTYSSPYIYDATSASNISVLDLGSGNLTANQITGGNAVMDSTGLTLTASSGAVVTFADATTQSTAGAPVASPSFTGDVTTTGAFISNNSVGDEGGEIKLAIPQTNTTLSTSVTLDIYQNKLRIFEDGGSNRGVYVDLTAASGSVGTNLISSASGMNIQTFGSPTSSGSFTWTKPANAMFVHVYLFGAGAGGGSGARRVTTSARSGGSGGGAGGQIWALVNASALGATETVTIGAGGSGGASVSTNSTNGNNGGLGGSTTFWRLRANGSPGNGFGIGGSTATVSGGFGANSQIFGTSQSGGSGGGGNTTSGSASASQSGANVNATGGGGGGGAGASSTLPAGGGAGGSLPLNTSFSGYTVAYAGGSGGTTAGVQATNGTSQTNELLRVGFGGGGGFYRTGGTGGTGGNGGWPSGGGGGGGASDDGFASGAGGNGANGYAVIITYF